MRTFPVHMKDSTNSMLTLDCVINDDDDDDDDDDIMMIS